MEIFSLKPVGPRVPGMGNKFHKGLLEVMVRGVTPTSSPWVPNSYFLPFGETASYNCAWFRAVVFLWGWHTSLPGIISKLAPQLCYQRPFHCSVMPVASKTLQYIIYHKVGSLAPWDRMWDPMSMTQTLCESLTYAPTLVLWVVVANPYLE